MIKAFHMLGYSTCWFFVQHPAGLFSPSILDGSLGSGSSAGAFKMPGGSNTSCCTSTAPAPSGAAQDRREYTVTDLLLYSFYTIFAYNSLKKVMISVKREAPASVCHGLADYLITDRKIVLLQLLWNVLLLKQPIKPPEKSNRLRALPSVRGVPHLWQNRLRDLPSIRGVPHLWQDYWNM